MGGRGLPLLALLLFTSAVAASSGGGGGGGGSGVRGAEAARNVTLVIKYDYYKRPVSASCMTSDVHQSLSITGLPKTIYSNPSYETKGSYQTASLTSFHDMSGVTCSIGDNQATVAPIIHPQALLIPDHRKVTVSKGEALRLSLPHNRHWYTETVRWRKESSQNLTWKKAIVNNNGELVIPSDELEGSGLYSVELTARSRSHHKHGVFVVVVKESQCPAQRYGKNCEGWCPDCLHGGKCDATSGECLCPVGLTGHRCQIRCEDGFIGSNCSLPLGITAPRGHVVCRGGLMGCTCAPGYYGDYCEHQCRNDQWGVECKQSCPECDRTCFYTGCKPCSLWGKCSKTKTRRCNQGDLGLPRLRQPASISPETPHSAVVSFKAWQSEYDDGELPRGATITYYSSLTSQTDQRAFLPTPPVNQTTINLHNLKENTTYYVKVLVAVTMDGRRCDDDRDRRGRVHTTAFTTLPCPDPPKLEAFTSVVPSDTSLDVQWQDMKLKNGCDPKYNLRITPGGHTYFPLSDHHKKVEGLKANTEYTITLHSCDQAGRKCDYSSISTTRRTLPGKLSIYVQERQDSHWSIAWGVAEGGNSNLMFRTKYEIQPEPRDFVASSEWSGWNSVRKRRIAVYPFTNITVSVQAKNDGGTGRIYSSTFAIPPSEPGQVRQLTLQPGANFISVEWQEPRDDPPKGSLESFKILWGETDKQSPTKSVSLTANTKQFIIRDLKPNINYWIKIFAKNYGVKKYGPATISNATTNMGVPHQVKILEANATKSSLILMWRLPSGQVAVVSSYRVLLYNANNILQKNITVNAPQAELTGLSHSQQYLAKVAACNMRHCSPVKELKCWTRPAPPSLQGTVNLVVANDTTITILMPLLANPPGTHTVVVQREGREPVTEAWKKTLKNTAMIRLEESHAGSLLSPEQGEAGHTEVYIAATVEQNGDERLQVTVGGGKTANSNLLNPALQKNAAYWVVVVTEKRSGQYVERVAGVPRRFVASPSTSTAWIAHILIGLAMLAIVAAAAATIVVVYRRKRRDRLAARRRKRHISDTRDSSLPQPADAPLPMAPINASQRNSCTENIYSNATLQVKMDDIEAYLLRAVMSRDTKIEFENVPSFLCHNYFESSRPENRSKNRYRNRVPYDDTRVILPQHNGVPHSDYINANYVQGPTQTAAFIAAEGPLQETAGAFWRMVWHTSCPTILMVANLKEGKRVKVAQYWPDHHPRTTEGVTVTPTGVTVEMDFVIRTFTISVGGIQRKISQYQYTAWPDHGVPTMPFSIAQMIKLVRSEHVHHKPIAVHCSAGIGRTGTVILVMYLLDQLQARGTITPVEALTALRLGRGRLVENSEQYVFAHKVLHEILFGNDFSYQCDSFPECLTDLLAKPPSPDASSPLQQQYQKLLSLPKDLTFKHTKDPAYAHLNRNQDILPGDSRMVMVQGRRCEDDTPYINVVRINSVDRKDAYLAGEHPQKHTLDKMWRLVYERNVAVWVLLHSFPDGHPEFPDVACVSPKIQSNMILKVGPTHVFENFYGRQVDICVTSLQGQIDNHRCMLLNLRGWPAADCLPTSPEPLLAVIERMDAFSSQNQPLLFTCKDGVTGCGVMAALLLAVSRTKLMNRVDIYHSVASVQQDRPQFVVNLEQYIFLHSAMAAFLTSSDKHFENFPMARCATPRRD